MPYAAKATVEHEVLTDHLDIYVTFRHPMHISSEPLTTPPVWDIMPPLALWLLETDGTPLDIVASEWLDLWTLKLTSDTIANRPAIVELEYSGPNENLATSWGKQWEPFGPIPSTDLTATLWKAGMIILWSGSVASVPSGWHLCDGTNGTPNLKNRFIVGAGDTYAVNATGGSLTHSQTASQPAHNHAATQPSHTHTFSISGGGTLGTGNNVLANQPNGQYLSTFTFAGGGITAGATPAITVPNATPAITVTDGTNTPPYYALAYIMKL